MDFDQQAQKAVLVDYITEVNNAAARIERLERNLDEAVLLVPENMRAVIEALQVLAKSGGKSRRASGLLPRSPSCHQR